MTVLHHRLQVVLPTIIVLGLMQSVTFLLMTIASSVAITIAQQVSRQFIPYVSLESQVALITPTVPLSTLCVVMVGEPTSVAAVPILTAKDMMQCVTPTMITVTGVPGQTAGKVRIPWSSPSNSLTPGCESDSNCPEDRPVCGAGAGEGSATVDSHRCGCSTDGDCSGGKICEGNVCVEGCRSRW